MHPPVVTKDPAAVAVEVQAAFLAMFPDGDRAFIPRAFGWAVDCFSGNHKDYRPVDAPYHDLEHTMQGTLCMARLLRARHAAGAEPRLTEAMCRLGLLAILLHDTGYLKKREDVQGTGAKYTITHVERSARFAGELLAAKGFSTEEAGSVQRMIRCTGLDYGMRPIVFQSELEKTIAFSLGTGDLLGQMAAEDYIERLPALYSEFAEAARFSKDKSHFVALYSSAEELMRKTPAFWEEAAQEKLNRDFGKLYLFLNDPYPDGPNPYLKRIEANMERLRARLASKNG
jgi:hypothetical protein